MSRLLADIRQLMRRFDALHGEGEAVREMARTLLALCLACAGLLLWAVLAGDMA